MGVDQPVRHASDDPHPCVEDRLLWSSSGLRVRTSHSDCPTGGWCPPHEGRCWGVAVPERGGFRRRVRGVEQFVDANNGFFRRAGEVSEVAHPLDVVHSGTIIDVDPDAATPVLAELSTASGAFAVSPGLDLAHRRLVAAIARRDHDVQVERRCLLVLQAALVQRRPDFTSVTRRSTAQARRRIVNDVCEHVHRDPSITLVELGRRVHYSPFHLSRIFVEVTGVALSRYRIQLRVHEVVRRLAAGACRLDEVALVAGFADHSHMTRHVVGVHGLTPSMLRRELRPA